MMALLKAFVVGAGVLIVFGFALLVLLLIERERGEAPAGERSVALPAGMRVVQLRPDGRRLVLLLEDSGGAQAVLVLDAASGEALGLFHLVQAGPR